MTVTCVNQAVCKPLVLHSDFSESCVTLQLCFGLRPLCVSYCDPGHYQYFLLKFDYYCLFIPHLGLLLPSINRQVNVL